METLLIQATIINYGFTDYYPVMSDIIYYRLRQEDFDGKFAYSNVVSVKMTGQNISIIPNPFDNVLTIHSNLDGDVDIKIYDVLGRLLYQINKKSENGALSIQPELLSGTYLVTIQTEAFIEQRKIIKK